MSLEAIKTISGAEESARKIRQDAAADAKRALADAEAQGRVSAEAAVKKAEEELKELRRQADEKAKAQAEELAQSTENKKAAMRVRAQSRLDKAASLIVERIVSS